MGLAWSQIISGVSGDLQVALHKVQLEYPNGNIKVDHEGVSVYREKDTTLPFFFAPWPEEFRRRDV